MIKLVQNVFTTWRRGICRGFVTVWRERGWVTAFGALTGVFLLLQLIIIVLMGVEGLESLLKSRTDLRLEIIAEAKDQDIQNFLSSMRELPYVDNSIYITREQAYSQMKEHDPELITFLEEFELENPFPETVAVTLNSLDDYDQFAIFIKEDQWHTVVDPSFLSAKTDQEAYVYELIHFTNTGRALAIFFLILTIGILIFVTTELVRGRVLRRSEEILVEHLSGAQTLAILLPFIVEAIILLAISIAGSFLITIGILFALPQVVPAITQQGSLQAIGEEIEILIRTRAPTILLIELLAIPVIGWIGAWLGIMPKINSRSLVLHRH